MQEASPVTRVTQPSTKMVTPILAPLSIVSKAMPSGMALRSNSFFSRFNSDKRGSTAIIFALMVAPIMMMTGIAVDFSRMVTVKARMQTALDAAALAGARAAQTTSTNVTVVAQNAASTYFNAIAMPFVTTKTLSNVSTDLTQTVFTWTATSWVKTPFMTIGGFVKPQAADSGAPAGCTSSYWICQKIVTKASTTLQAGGINIETSFMLDITGSMAGQKIADLKSAANDAIDILVWPDQSKYTSRVAITPFAQDVRLPTAAAFLKATGTAAANLTGTGTYNNQSFHKYANQLCVAERAGVNKYTDAAPNAANGFVMSPWSWDGWGTECDVPTGAVATPLTTDKTQLHNLITALTPSGGTAGHLGTAWAWYMLSPNWNTLWAPVNQAAAYDTAYNVNTKVGDPKLQKLKKVAILMTDGDYNQEYASSGKMTYFGGSPANGTSSVQATALCTSMKAQGIEVYTVAFGDGLSSTAQTLLTNCATDTSHFYNAVTGDALRAAFRDIALKISTLRITQ
jgi:Flp pilus assembly protein TadG